MATATVEKVMLNSYMLPHGARSTESARVSTPPNSMMKPSAVREMAMRPYRSPCASPPAAPGPSGTSRAPAAARVTTCGRSMTAVPPSFLTVTAGAAAFVSGVPVSAAAVRPTLLRLPKIHSAMFAKNASRYTAIDE